MCDVETNSTINQRFRENETVIEGANEVEFVIHNGNVNIAISK